MYIESVTIKGFRGLNMTARLAAPLAVIAGPNNSGKSAIVDALRSLLSPVSGRGGKRYIRPSDFTEGAATPEITISVVLRGIEPAQLGTFVSVLAPSLGTDAAILGLHSRLDLNGRPVTSYLGGELLLNRPESIALEAVSFVYLPALRDAESDLRPGSSNRLADLVSAFAPNGHIDRETIVTIAEKANSDLRQVNAIISSVGAVQSRLSKITKSGPFAHKADMSFSEARYERIVSTLQALAGGALPVDIRQNGLGYNNLVYMAVLLAAIESEPGSPLTVLLVEEPEAHLHPQLQGLLMEYLVSISTSTTHVITTTHSPQFASTASVEKTTVLTRTDPASSPSAHLLLDAGLSTKESDYLRRFLDVTKASLLFAQSVILVEGTAEQLLVPALAARLGVNLTEHGVSVISVDGVSFGPFIKLFSDTGLPTRCAIISDSDPYTDAAGIEHDMSAVAQQLITTANDKIRVHLSEKTLEWQIAFENSATPTLLRDALASVHPRTPFPPVAAAQKIDDRRQFADEFLSVIKKSKGPYAQELARQIIETSDIDFNVPSYIIDAIRWASSPSDAE